MSYVEETFKKIDAAVAKIRNASSVNITFQNGQQVSGRMMCTFDCDYNNRLYMIFTDDTKTPDGLYNAYAATFHKLLGFGPYGIDEMKIELVGQGNQEEIKMIQDVIKKELSTGFITKKPICKLQFGRIAAVSFE